MDCLPRLALLELLTALEDLEWIGMIRDGSLGSGRQHHDALHAVDVGLCGLDAAEVLAVTAEDEGLVFLSVVEYREFDRRHSRCMSRCEIQLQCGVAKFDRSSIGNDAVTT